MCICVCVADHKHTYIYTHETSITSGQLKHITSKLTPPFHMRTDLGDIHTYTQAHTQAHTQAQAHTHTHILGDKKISGIVVNYSMCKCRRANPL